MTDLEIRIKDAAQKYYTDGTSPLSDVEFDALVDQLRKENPDSEIFRTGWGYNVAADSTPGMKRDHIYTEVGSLDKCHDIKELGNNMIGKALDASTKLDGLSAVLYYIDGILQYGLTRGNGSVGIDITDKLLAINPQLAKTNVPFTGAVRGEILMSSSNFEEFKKIHPEAKNARNSTAGLINGKEITEDFKFLDIIFYTVIHNKDHQNSENPAKDSIKETRELIAKMFTPEDVVLHREIFISPNTSNEDFLAKMNELKADFYQDYPADGIVLSQEIIGCNEGTYVYTAKAFKFPAESKRTFIKYVEWNMSKSKIAVPRILLEPIELSGTTVQACAGYHAGYIKENNLGPGSEVEVRKSGEIIPQIIAIHKSTHAEIPEVCPECGQPLTWDGYFLKCTNDMCSNSIEQDLLVWLQNLVPTDNLGDTLKMKFINQLVDNGSIDDCSIESVMNCKIRLSEDSPSTQFNNFAKMWNNLHDPNFKFDLVHALIACNVPRIGDLTALKFSKYPDAIIRHLDDILEGAIERPSLSKIIGDANARSVESHDKKFGRLNLIRDRIIWNTKPKAEFKGKVAITGKLSVKRSDFEAELRRHGYEPSDTINKDTKFLITENPDGQSSKNLKAAKLGITKINEFDFRFKYLS